MKLLAWDTSAKAGTIVALEFKPEASSFQEVRLAGEWALNVDSQHSERLLWGIHQLLQSAQWKLEQVDLFGVGIGPGSFTGLRIGVTTARTLAHAVGKPLIGVSSLAAMARPLALSLTDSDHKDTHVIVATDACKGELFALWGKAKDVAQSSSFGQLWSKSVHEEVITPSELAKKLAKVKGSWIALGEGRSRYPQAWEGLAPKRELSNSLAFSDHVQGRYLGMLVWEAFQAKVASQSLEVHPRYLRGSDAEVKLKSGKLKPSPELAPKAFRDWT